MSIARLLLLTCVFLGLAGLPGCGGNGHKDHGHTDHGHKDHSHKDESKKNDATTKDATSKDASSKDSSSKAGNNGDSTQGSIQGWPNWRGPHQAGTSDQTGLPDKADVESPLWTLDMQGRGSPVFSNGKMYAIGYTGEKEDLTEHLLCLNPETGEEHWRLSVRDFLSDIIYNRYAIGAPTVDPETGNIYYLSTPRVLYCVAPEGKVVWSNSLVERHGMNTYPNGRTGSPAIDGDLCIVHGVSNNWGAEGPPRDRFFAFDKKTGDHVWTSAPGQGPPFLKDSSFSNPYFAWLGDKRVFYAGDGSGNVVCVNARTGEQVWRYRFSFGGINSSVVVHDGAVIAVHGKEDEQSSDHGGLVKLNPAAEGTKDATGLTEIAKDAEIWRTKQNVQGNPDIVAFTSSPVLNGDDVYLTVATGELVCIDAKTGKRKWHKKLSIGQIHASPLFADGKLYVPMNAGEFYILKPTDTGVEELSKTQLQGNCLGAPAVWNGKVYVFTNEKFYCFGEKRDKDESPTRTLWKWKPNKIGEATALQIVPGDVLLRPGDTADIHVRKIDANGHVVGEVDSANVNWTKFIPPTAKVKAEMDAAFNMAGDLMAGPDAKQSAGAWKGTYEGLAGVTRGRVLAKLPFEENFDDYELSAEKPDGTKFAYPPLPWPKTRFVWEVREIEGNKVLVKTLDRLILQRMLSFIGHPDMRNYTFQADLRSDGNRRLMSDVGIINQRYVITLKGNHQQVEVNSNHERLKVSVPFQLKQKVWYTVKSRVDIDDKGDGVVRAKVWRKGEEEPDAWTIEVPHVGAHTHGAPGLFGFTINTQIATYVDNIKITPND